MRDICVSMRSFVVVGCVFDSDVSRVIMSCFCCSSRDDLRGCCVVSGVIVLCVCFCFRLCELSICCFVVL